MNRHFAALTAAAAALFLANAAQAQHSAPNATPKPATANLQGDDSVWRNSPYMHSFYDLSKASLAGGAAKLDVAAYEQKSYAIFRDFGVAMGVGPEHMQDHLKLIPRQIVGIAKEDPHVLDNYDNFILALMGPK